jgi:hypothetical protein
MGVDVPIVATVMVMTGVTAVSAVGLEVGGEEGPHLRMGVAVPGVATGTGMLVPVPGLTTASAVGLAVGQTEGPRLTMGVSMMGIAVALADYGVGGTF